METRIIKNFVEEKIKTSTLEKPILIITLTDGIPDSKKKVINTIEKTIEMTKASKYGSEAVSFSFAQIGTDKYATEYLEKLDKDENVGKHIDCTSEFSIEQKQCEKNYGFEFTESMWLIKLMIGAIDSSYDNADE